MPAMTLAVPVLSMLVSLEGQVEREISRDILVEVAPDREEFLRSATTIDEIRQSLKLRTNSVSRHWLDRVKIRNDFSVQELSTRFSSYGLPLSGTSTVRDENTGVTPRILRREGRRALSTSAVNYTVPNKSAHPARPTSTMNIKPLSALDTSTSPRLLGPTHILIVYATQASKNSLSFFQKRDASNTFRDTRRRTMVAPTFPEVAEIPINDLLFLLNVPNLVPAPPATASGATGGSSHGFPVLPRRLSNEMPHVMLYVPHLETFHDLVIYLHTKNQAALFRSIIPEWIRDTIHPLPVTPPPAPAVLQHVESDSVSTFSFDGLNIKRLFGKLVPENLPFPNVGVRAVPLRTLSSVAIELAGMTLQLDSGEDDLLVPAAGLTALSNNLDYIGYYDKDLWSELTSYRSILLQAISHCANVNFIATNQ